jgi:hypoxanthine phosphoribosyltransferase
MADPPRGEPLLSAEEVAARVATLAGAIAPRVDDDTVAVCLLTGGLWFASDLTRGLAVRGRNLLFDCLWLSTYGDARASEGAVRVHAPLQRSVEGRRVLLLDDVFDTGVSLAFAARLCRQAGAREVLSAVFARKPWPEPRGVQPDFVGWEAPARYLVGYGLDDAGRGRGWPGVAALD